MGSISKNGDTLREQFEDIGFDEDCKDCECSKEECECILRYSIGRIKE